MAHTGTGVGVGVGVGDGIGVGVGVGVGTGVITLKNCTATNPFVLSTKLTKQ
jgi:hypothetical protein